MGEEIRNITLTSIIPHPGNRRIGGFDQAKLEELAASIKAVGVQQPAVIRPYPEDGKYQIVTGERRWRAAKIAGLAALPCVIREFSDSAVLKLQTIENLQREDIHPLDEAEGYRRLIDGDIIDEPAMDVKQLAEEVGKSISYIYQRLKLGDLTDEARQALIENQITPTQAIPIARLQKNQQKETLTYIERSYNVSVRELSAWIKKAFYLILSSASFKRDDKELYAKAGPCTTCEKRSGHNPALFDDLGGKDHCLDSKCFNRKLDEMVKRREKELEGEDHHEVYREWKTNPKEKALKAYDWQECKKKDKGAKRTLILDGTDRGKLIYAKKRERVSTFQRFETPEEEAKYKKERHEQIVNSNSNQILTTKIHDKLVLQYNLAEDKWDKSIFFILIPMIVDFVYGVDWDQLYEKYGLELPESYDDSQLLESLAKLRPEDLEMVTIEMIIRSRGFEYGEVIEESKVFAWAKDRGIKVKALQKSAREEAEKNLLEEEKKDSKKNGKA